MNLQMVLQYFDKWDIDFVGPINPPGRKSGAHYIIIATYYVTRWVEAKPVKDFTIDTVALFIFENIVTWFGCPRILISDQETYFLNDTMLTSIGMPLKFIVEYNSLKYTDSRCEVQ